MTLEFDNLAVFNLLVLNDPFKRKFLVIVIFAKEVTLCAVDAYAEAGDNFIKDEEGILIKLLIIGFIISVITMEQVVKLSFPLSERIVGECV